MYNIGNIVLGTYLPWDEEIIRHVVYQYFMDDPLSMLPAGESKDDIADGLKDGSIDWRDFELFETPMEGWDVAYHGAADLPVAWCGVVIGRIDVTDHIRLKDITKLLPASLDQYKVAGAKYDALPPGVRGVLPEFGVYIVWSSS